MEIQNWFPLERLCLCACSSLSLSLLSLSLLSLSLLSLSLLLSVSLSVYRIFVVLEAILGVLCKHTFQTHSAEICVICTSLKSAAILLHTGLAALTTVLSTGFLFPRFSLTFNHGSQFLPNSFFRSFFRTVSSEQFLPNSFFHTSKRARD
jgi:hypothetical protein